MNEEKNSEAYKMMVHPLLDEFVDKFVLAKSQTEVRGAMLF